MNINININKDGSSDSDINDVLDVLSLCGLKFYSDMKRGCK